MATISVSDIQLSVKDASGVVLHAKEKKAPPVSSTGHITRGTHLHQAIVELSRMAYESAGVCKVPPPLKLQPATEWNGSQIVASWSATPLIISTEDEQLEHENRWEAEQAIKEGGGMYGDGDYSYLREKSEY